MTKVRFFKSALIILVLLIITVGTYESLSQRYRPDSSILSLSHRYGYLKGYAVVYEPSKGIWHPLAWTGSGMLVTMMLYSVRKRVSLFSSLGSLRHWLNVHMLLGIFGSIFITFHTTFKLGGIISTAFWCMIVTVIFGIIGRYIYIQIPRNIDGTELQAIEVDRMVQSVNFELEKHVGEAELTTLFRQIETLESGTDDLNPFKTLINMMKTDIVNAYRVSMIKRTLRKRYHLNHKVREEIAGLLKKKSALIRRRNLLSISHKLLHYWHVFHIPLAIVMFLIMFLHIGVYFLFGTT